MGRLAIKITAPRDPVDVVRPRQAPPSYHVTQICPGAPANGPERWLDSRLLMGRYDMQGLDSIRTAVERSARAVELRPSVGQGTAVTKVRLRDGLSCEVEDGPWKFTVGMTDAYGGSNAGPNPGVYGRGAVGSCLAIGYSI